MGCIKSSPAVSATSSNQNKSASTNSKKPSNHSPAIVSRKPNTNPKNNASSNIPGTKSSNHNENEEDDDNNNNDAESVDSRRVSPTKAKKQKEQLNENTKKRCCFLNANQRTDTTMVPSTKQNLNEEANLTGVIEQHHLADEADEHQLKLQMQNAERRKVDTVSSALHLVVIDTIQNEATAIHSEERLRNAQPYGQLQVVINPSEQQESKPDISDLASPEIAEHNDQPITISQLGVQLHSRIISGSRDASPPAAAAPTQELAYTNAVLRSTSSFSTLAIQPQKSIGSIAHQTSGIRLTNSNIVTSGLDYDAKRRELVRKFSDGIEELDEIDENTYQIGGTSQLPVKSTTAPRNFSMKTVTEQDENHPIGQGIDTVILEQAANPKDEEEEEDDDDDDDF